VLHNIHVLLENIFVDSENDLFSESINMSSISDHVNVNKQRKHQFFRNIKLLYI